ncbi:MAG: metallophosphoesterase [Candidatus Melainabacteria bacterium]|nr:metallophosphoesterase [Candidatus Melainabacteria bacterium]
MKKNALVAWLALFQLLVLSPLSAIADTKTGETEQKQAGASVQEVFLVKPYLQLGESASQAVLAKQESLELIWFTTNNGKGEKWQVQSKSQSASKWSSSKSIQAFFVGKVENVPFYRYTVKIEGLAPGEKFSYKVLRNGSIAFDGSATARKSFNQPYSFAVFGDVGAGSAGEKKIIYQVTQRKPDLVVMPGDITYDQGRISQYLARFFPIVNSQESAPDKGGPLLSSSLVMTALGNHDIAMTTSWKGTDLNRFPDALGYYIFWSLPFNGPKFDYKIGQSTRNVLPLVGNETNVTNFLKAADKRYPQIGNYSFDYGNSHWLILDGNEYMHWGDEKLRAYVEDDLTKSKATWKFVSFHQPPFSIDIYHHSEHRMRLLCDIFERTGVQVVWCGHAHNYQRYFPLKFKAKTNKDGIPMMNGNGTVTGDFILDTKFNGTTQPKMKGVLYIVSGGGGASLYRRAPFLPKESEACHKFIHGMHSFTFCNIDDKTLSVSQISDDGKVLDQFKVETD